MVDTNMEHNKYDTWDKERIDQYRQPLNVFPHLIGQVKSAQERRTPDSGPSHSSTVNGSHYRRVGTGFMPGSS